MMMPRTARVDAIARAFALGPVDVPSLLARATAATGEPLRVVRPLAERVAHHFDGKPRPRWRDITALLTSDPAWLRRHVPFEASPRRRRRLTTFTDTPDMLPVRAARGWFVPPIPTTASLAEWLGVSVAELAWFSNVASLGQQEWAAPRHHYHYQVRVKPHGGIRVLEAPQARLKALQRRILTDILDCIPPWHSAAHGFVRGRSVRTFAQEHMGRTVVLRMDLAEFFPTVSRARVQAVFRTLGYPEPVADILGALCTNVTPAAMFAPARWPRVPAADLREARQRYTRPHLPQGAPTSPAIANLCAWRLDCRLTGLADWAGAVYSRYADDLAFSGDADVARRITDYATQIAAIAAEEGWRVQHHKTRIMRQGVRQRLAGLVVNARLNCPRRDVDALKATLTNCLRHGAASQNRDALPDFRAHLAGRIAWVRSVNPAKAQRLQAIFDQVDWGA